MLASIFQDEQVSTWLLPQDFLFPQWCKKQTVFLLTVAGFADLKHFRKKKRLLILPPVDSIDARRNGNCIWNIQVNDKK